jgi:hypothetical protein
MPRNCQDCNSLIMKDTGATLDDTPLGITIEDKPGFLAIALARVTNRSLDSTRGGERLRSFT